MTTTLFIAVTLTLSACYLWTSRRRERRATAVLERSVRDGLTEPASLHPVIDETKCIGCGSCVDACPEDQVLGLVEGRASSNSPCG